MPSSILHLLGRLRRPGLAASSGVLLSLAFAPAEQSWLAWVALVPLCLALWWDVPAEGAEELPPPAGGRRWTRWLRGRGARTFGLGWLAGFAFFLGTLAWLSEVTVAGWPIVCAGLALWWGLWAWWMDRVLRPRSTAAFLSSASNLLLAAAGSVAWTGIEWGRSVVFPFFPWNSLGVALHENLPFLQLAQWGGVGGLSLLLAWVNLIGALTLRRFWLEIRLGKVRPHFDFTVTMVLVLGAFLLGFRSLDEERLEPLEKKISLHFASVQPAIPQEEKFDDASSSRVFDTLRQLTEAAFAAGAQLVLWPEAATPRGVFFSQRDYDFVTGLAKEGNRHLIFGTLDHDFADNNQRTDYNAAVFLPRDAGDAGLYRKIRLVPFGEYIPLRREFPPFAWIVGDEVPSDFTSGREAVVWDLGEPAVKVGPLICFEDAIGEIARQPVLRGAQVLVNVTNDAWFHRSSASRQHLANAVFRAAENRRPLLRCANTGMTAHVDASGRVVALLRDETGDTFGRGLLSGVTEALREPRVTFYARNGDVLAKVCAVFAAVHLALALAMGRRGKMPGEPQADTTEGSG